MATNAADRAARRTSINAARRSAAAQPTPDPIEEVFEDAPQASVSEPAAPSSPRSRVQTAPPADQAPSDNAQAPIRPAFRPVSGALALPMRDMSRELGAGDMVIPKLKLAQGLSSVSKLYASSRGKEGIPAGVWYYTTGNRDLGETVYFIPCDMRKSRSVFTQGQGVTCRSFDLIHGEGDPGTLCEGTAEEMGTMPENERGCMLRLWNRTAAGNKPPTCGLNYNYTGLIVTDPEHPESSDVLQAMLQMRSTHINAAKSINTAVMTFGAGVWSNTIIELTVDSRSNTKGEFFVPVADFYDTADSARGWEKIARKASAFARQLGAADLRATMEHDPDAE